MWNCFCRQAKSQACIPWYIPWIYAFCSGFFCVCWSFRPLSFGVSLLMLEAHLPTVTRFHEMLLFCPWKHAHTPKFVWYKQYDDGNVANYFPNPHISTGIVLYLLSIWPVRSLDYSNFRETSLKNTSINKSQKIITHFIQPQTNFPAKTNQQSRTKPCIYLLGCTTENFPCHR